MATTTANISISSSDLIPGMAMNYYKSSTLHKAGSCTGLSRIQSGTKDYSSTSTVELLDESVVTTGGAITVFIQSEELGRLYAGDWMFIPWSAGSSNNVQVAPSVATSMKLEYVLVHE